MKKRVLVICYLLFSISGFSQLIGYDYFHKTQHFDFIEIRCPEDVLLKIKYPAVNIKDSLRQVENSIGLLISTTKQALQRLDLNENYTYEIIFEYPISCWGVECKKKENLNIKVSKIETNSNEYLLTQYGDSIINKKPNNIIKFPDDFVEIHLADFSLLDSIQKIDFKKFRLEYCTSIFDKKQYKYDLKSSYRYNNGEFKKEYCYKVRKRKPYLAIRPSVGVGINFIKGQITNDGSILIESSFNDYDEYAIRFYAQYQIITNYIDQKVYTSGFLNIGVNHNKSNSYEPKDWIGFGLGYLVHNQEMSPFNKNTIKLYFERQIKIGLKIKPEIYYDINKAEMFLGFSLSQNI